MNQSSYLGLNKNNLENSNDVDAFKVRFNNLKLVIRIS